jgi:uncharacterized protein GlcG (DUF336 family)
MTPSTPTASRSFPRPVVFAGIAATGLAYLFLSAGNAPKATAQDKVSQTVKVAEGHAMPKGEPLATKDISLDQAHAIIAAAAAKAGEINTKMDIAVVDAGGNLKAFVRMDGAWLGSIDIAIKKAHTARWFDMPTGEIGKLSQPGGPLYNIEHSNGGLISFPGGIPLKLADGTIIGAIGVSGSTVENDHTVAEAGVAAMK